MLYQKVLTLLTLLTPLTLASIIPIPLESRACAYSCASHCYTKATVSAAQDAGYKLYSTNNDVNDYPHQYHNYEDFDFPVPGDYYEFPIMSSGGTYNGGSPGADRVIFNTKDQLAGVITHSGASGGDFLACAS